MAAPGPDADTGESAPQWEPPPAAVPRPYALEVGRTAPRSAHRRWPLTGPMREPSPADASAGELSAIDVVEALEGLGDPELSALWLLDPADQRLVYGRWVLDGPGLDRLHELHRAGVSLRPAWGTYERDEGPVEWKELILFTITFAGIVTAVGYVFNILDPESTNLPGWPFAPLIAVAVAGVTGFWSWRLGDESSGLISSTTVGQVQELIETISRLRVRAPSPAAAELAIRIRTAWAEATDGLEPTRTNSAEWMRLGRHVDELLHALALSQPSGRRPMRPELLGWVEHRIDRLLSDLELAAGQPAPDGPAAMEQQAPDPIEDRAIVHYPRYDPSGTT